MIAFCWVNGQIEFGRRLPTGAIEVARGGQDVLEPAVRVLARQGYDGKTLFVPGIPEAQSEKERLDALLAWMRWAAQTKAARRIHFNALGAQRDSED
ncbi:hypothetical protein ACTJI2_13560 [Pseudoxanthomonas sp. 22568]|uniref:hypothetical protein n=1 Tax=Pseudoxanthomonas sp. 22568 TaxID=3453945 RepID=UPI003F84CC8C